MKGQSEIIEALNRVLTNELTAINQYFVHARMMEDWGLAKIGSLEYKAAIDEMKHADELIKRVLFLEDLPNVQRMGAIKIGQDIQEVLQADLQLEMAALPSLKESIALAEERQDYVSRELFSEILKSEEEHVDWLEIQLGLVEKIGKERYMQSQIHMG